MKPMRNVWRYERMAIYSLQCGCAGDSRRHRCRSRYCCREATRNELPSINRRGGVWVLSVVHRQNADRVHLSIAIRPRHGLTGPKPQKCCARG